MTLTFLLTALVVVVTPGIVPHLVAAVTGAAALLRASGLAFEVVKLLGVAYLLGLAVMTWRDKSRLATDSLGHLLLLSSVFMAMTLAVFAIYGICASRVRGLIVRRPMVVRRLRQVFALSFLGIGARLATSER